MYKINVRKKKLNFPEIGEHVRINVICQNFLLQAWHDMLLYTHTQLYHKILFSILSHKMFDVHANYVFYPSMQIKNFCKMNKSIAMNVNEEMIWKCLIMLPWIDSWKYFMKYILSIVSYFQQIKLHSCIIFYLIHLNDKGVMYIWTILDYLFILTWVGKCLPG